jgi:hypothetical protein
MEDTNEILALNEEWPIEKLQPAHSVSQPPLIITFFTNYEYVRAFGFRFFKIQYSSRFPYFWAVFKWPIMRRIIENG